MLALRDFLTNFHIGAASGWDIFIFLVFLIAVLLYGLFLGRNRIVVLLLSSYFSWVILQSFPWTKLSSLGFISVGSDPSAPLQILIFVGLILTIYFLLPRSALSSVLRIKKRGDAFWWQLLLLAVVQVGFLVMAILSFLSSKEVANLAPLIKKTFVGEEPQFVWVLLPIIILLLTKRKKSKDGKK
jgi:hypothetical protein